MKNLKNLFVRIAAWLSRIAAQLSPNAYGHVIGGDRTSGESDGDGRFFVDNPL